MKERPDWTPEIAWYVGMVVFASVTGKCPQCGSDLNCIPDTDVSMRCPSCVFEVAFSRESLPTFESLYEEFKNEFTDAFGRAAVGSEMGASDVKGIVTKG